MGPPLLLVLPTDRLNQGEPTRSQVTPKQLSVLMVVRAWLFFNGGFCASKVEDEKALAEKIFWFVLVTTPVS